MKQKTKEMIARTKRQYREGEATARASCDCRRRSEEKRKIEILQFMVSSVSEKET